MLNAFPDGRHHDPAPHEEDHHDGGGGDLVGSVAEVPGAAPAVGKTCVSCVASIRGAHQETTFNNNNIFNICYILSLSFRKDKSLRIIY